MTTIPNKYLNTNVRAMLSGGKEESEKSEPETKKPILHLDKFFSFFKIIFPNKSYYPALLLISNISA